MKLLPILLAVTLTPLPAFAGWQTGQSGWSRQCFRNVYRETYVPGTESRPGYVRRWNERKEVPCYNAGADGYLPNPHYLPADEPQYRPQHSRGPVDDNSCIEGSILGGIAGGAAGAALSRDEGMIYGIPLGIVGGALIGCQIDGG